MSDEPDQPWFHAGLRFECTRCGRCCRGPGNVWVSDLEIEALAETTGIDAFRESHLKRSGRRGRVLRQKRNQDCIFWDDTDGCRVYASRPRQCRTYPFWKANLLSEQDWNAATKSCPGVAEGVLHGREIIESMFGDDGIPDHRTRSHKP